MKLIIVPLFVQHQADTTMSIVVVQLTQQRPTFTASSHIVCKIEFGAYQVAKCLSIICAIDKKAKHDTRSHYYLPNYSHET